MSDRKTEMLEKVRKLLAKANDASVGEAESEAFRLKADEIMTAYAIDSWELAMADSSLSAKPIRRDFDWSWYQDSRDGPLKSALWTIWYHVADHCRVIQVSGKRNWEAKTIPVVGLDSDLDYFDMMFTSLMLQLTMKSDPRPQPTLSFEENLAVMREAGFGWDKVCRRMIEAGLVEDPNPGVPFPRDRADWKTQCRERFLLSERLVRRYREWCKETNRPQTYTNVKTYREHFAAGFADAISSRLWRMRRESEASYNTAHSTNGGHSAEVAIRDIRQVVKEAYWEFYPEFAPHPADCDCDNCHYAKCKNRDTCQRSVCVEMRKPVRYRSSGRSARKIDYSARAAGEQAGREANLHGNPQRGLRKTPEIDK